MSFFIFDAGFKQDAVNYYHSSGKTGGQVAKELKIAKPTNLGVRQHIIAKLNVKLLLAVLSKLLRINSKNALYFYGKCTLSQSF